MNINLLIRTIRRWINIRVRDGYKIVGYGFNGPYEIVIKFEKVKSIKTKNMERSIKIKNKKGRKRK